MNWKEKTIDIIALAISIIIGLITFWWVIDTINLDVDNENSKVDVKERDINPKLILQQRYARGEIDNIEYLERMVRL